ncbi:hypothetical protein V1514DRAFT_336110 [Lipomyces japonicus]|uniref:uncharacterized protein n=1 Tax=Lipomyces japonicus TaxID=56871 RepID=UPI0034CE85AC
MSRRSTRTTKKQAPDAQAEPPVEITEPAAPALNESAAAKKTSSEPPPTRRLVQVEGINAEEALEEVGSVLFEAAQKTNAQEKRLGVLLGGYINRQKTLSNKFTEAHAAFTQSSIQSYIFEGPDR